LRERPEDIAPLALRFAIRAASDMGRESASISPDAIDLLTAYPWPGNVRELQHAVERAVILSSSPVLQPHHFDAQREGSHHPLAQALLHGTGTDPMPIMSGLAGRNGIVLQTLNVDDAERALIRRALEITGDNRTRAADLLGISVRTLRNKLNGSRRPQNEGALASPAAPGRNPATDMPETS
jgi:DNA-binding NtrC family response regulator